MRLTLTEVRSIVREALLNEASKSTSLVGFTGTKSLSAAAIRTITASPYYHRFDAAEASLLNSGGDDSGSGTK